MPSNRPGGEPAVRTFYGCLIWAAIIVLASIGLIRVMEVLL